MSAGKHKLCQCFRVVANQYIFQPKHYGAIHNKCFAFSTTSEQYHQLMTIHEAREKLTDLVGTASRIWLNSKPEQVQIPKTVLTQAELPERRMADSYQEIVIPLGSDPMVREKYLNFYQGIRFGRLLEDLDTFAVLISYTHATHDTVTEDHHSPISIVTALVDRIELEEQPILPNKDIKMTGNVTWAGRSSIEVTMKLHQEDSGKWDQLLSAKFVMVARNPVTKKSAEINKLVPHGEAEELLFKAGEVSKIKRQEEGKQTLLKTAPTEQERQLIHNLFLQTLDTSASTFRVRVKPENSVWMENTMLKNLSICFPEQRNLYNKIFGGYLMRKAFELAWANAAMYCKTKPYVTTVDDILFLKPVEIGSILFLSSQIVYTEGSRLQMKVHAEVVNPLTCDRATTNDFHFTFDTRKNDVPVVIPKSYAESMLYLDGKRHFAS